MEKGSKILRLCAALIKKNWAMALLNEVKNELGVKHKLYLLLKLIIQKHDSEGNLLDKSWSLSQWEKEKGNLPKTLWELKNIIEEFLLSKYQSEEYEVAKEIELYNIYRQLGLHKENLERFQKIEILVQKSKEKHTHLLAAIFKQEIAKITHQNTNHYIELTHAFYVYWISECLFDACMKSHPQFPHKDLLIASLSVEYIREIIEQSPILLNDIVVQVHLKLYDYLKLPSVSSDSAYEFETEVMSMLSALPLSRQQDIHVLINNKYTRMYVEHRTVFYAQLAWKQHEREIQNIWIHRGNNIEFSVYRNLIISYISANEYNQSQEMIGEQLLRYKALYEKDVIFPNRDDKKLQLFQILMNWKLRRNLIEIAEMNSASFTEENLKREMLQYQLKARYSLYEEGDVAYQFFWEWLGDKIRNKTLVIKGHYQFEEELWKIFYKIQKSPKKRLDCIEELKETRRFLANTEMFYNERNWYLSLIDKFIHEYA